MDVQASARYLPISAQKLRLVCDQVRGMDADQALAVLRFMPQKGAEFVYKLVESAIANAGTSAAAQDLWIREIAVNEGPSLPMWWKAGPRGAAMPRHRRTTHVTVVLTDKAEE